MKSHVSVWIICTSSKAMKLFDSARWVASTSI
jgi:hypothetical protein